MTPLATAAAKHNAADDEREREDQRDDIAEAREGRRSLGGGRKHGVDDAGGAPRQRFHDVAAGVDHRADAGRGRTQHREAFFGRAQTRLSEVLGRAPAAEPGVVRRIEDEAGAVVLVDDVAGEDDLVAQLEADLAPFPAEIDRTGPGPLAKSSSPGASRESPIAERSGRIGRYSP